MFIEQIIKIITNGKNKTIRPRNEQKMSKTLFNNNWNLTLFIRFKMKESVLGKYNGLIIINHDFSVRMKLYGIGQDNFFQISALRY